MDYKNVKQARWAFRFNQPNIKLHRINPITGEEKFMGDDWERGGWVAYVWKLDEAGKSWISIKVRIDCIKIWVKYVDPTEVNRNKARHFQVIIGRNDEQKIAIGDPDEMVRLENKTWTKKSLLQHGK